MRATALLLAATLATSSAHALSVSYLCFFEPDRADLTPRCEMILAEFTAAWEKRRRGELPDWPDSRRMAPAEAWRVEIGAHLDAAEGKDETTALDRRRGEAVADFIVSRGIPANLVRVLPLGAGRPLVPVGGAEAQNRRVELTTRSPGT